ncbi:ankyrin repeat domain-containing protein [Candidatus Dependentiae bacterium]|nr:ankyrin repeat domain-containing protein [Candidatus Dependentiae bacterium]
MLKKYLITLLILSFVPNLTFSMTKLSQWIIQFFKTQEKFHEFEKFPADIKLEILAQSFNDIVDQNKSVEENIKKLFAHRAMLMRLSPEIKELVGSVGRVRILQEIGNQLSKMISDAIELQKRIKNNEELVKAVSNFANNQDVIKALTYIKNEEGHTLMHQVAFYGDVNAIKILKQAGADVDAKNIHGDTPLLEATRRNITKAVKKLIEFGANANERNNYKFAPIHNAVINENLEMINSLLNAGANINVQDFLGKTPLDFAINRGNEDIKNYLIEHGAKSGKDLP